MLLNFDKWETSVRQYGGLAGRKEGLKDENGDYWLIKYSDNLREKHLKNVDISYDNNPVAEYIGSHVYELLDIPVHETYLGYRRGRLVVGCRDFAKGATRLTEFREYKVSYVPAFLTPDGDLTNGAGMDINEALECITKHVVLSKVDSVLDRFWLMFVVDALNGNPDRNNGNWGCLVDLLTEQTTLAPVYDNGNCLYFRMSVEQIRSALKTDMNQFAKGCISRYTDGEHKINPFSYLRKTADKSALNALDYVVSNLDLDAVYYLIDSVEVIPDTCKEFYKRLYSMRFSELASLSCKLTSTEAELWNSLPEALTRDFAGNKRDYLKSLGMIE